MKILYNDINLDKDFKHFKEQFYLSYSNNIIKKKEYFKYYNFIERNIIFTCIFILILIIYTHNYINNKIPNTLLLIGIFISIYYIMSYILIFLKLFIGYNKFKKLKPSKKKNSLTINDDGIIDVTENITLSSNWKNLTHILIGKYYIMITTTSNLAYIYPIEIKDKLLFGINKYNTNKKIKIIQK